MFSNSMINTTGFIESHFIYRHFSKFYKSGIMYHYLVCSIHIPMNLKLYVSVSSNFIIVKLKDYILKDYNKATDSYCTECNMLNEYGSNNCKW